MNTPTWIVFEGIDGSGKTTQAKRLHQYLSSHGVRSLYKHVFDSAAGKLFRELFINYAFSNTIEILILCAARQALLDELDVDGYDVVILDRFFLSILAMQGRNDNDIELINYIRRAIADEDRHSVVYFMNTRPEECDHRLDNRSMRDRLEEKGVEFHRSVADRYLTLLDCEENVYHFDGNGDIESVHRTIVDTTLAMLGITAGAGESSCDPISCDSFAARMPEIPCAAEV